MCVVDLLDVDCVREGSSPRSAETKRGRDLVSAAIRARPTKQDALNRNFLFVSPLSPKARRPAFSELFFIVVIIVTSGFVAD